MAIQHLRDNMPTFVLLEEGRNRDEKSIVMLEAGKFYGMGYIPASTDLSDKNYLKTFLTQYPENDFVRSMVLRHAEDYPQKKFPLK